MDWSKIIENLSSWLSGGWVGILLGLFGLGGIAIALRALSRRIKSARFNSAITMASNAAAEVSTSVSTQMAENDVVLDAMIKATQDALKAMEIPAIKCPGQVAAGESFVVELFNIPPQTPIYADQKHLLGHTVFGQAFRAILSTKGERTVDAKIGEQWVSSKVTVV